MQDSQKVVGSNALDRRQWLSVLAKAPAQEIKAAWARLECAPDGVELRAPETGMVMVRGRVGGAGSSFNLGEMTVTRCAMRLDSGETGVGYAAGRDKEHARIAAIVDAMMQSENLRPLAEQTVVMPLAKAALDRRSLAARKTASTKVEFFTLVTGRQPK
ncbi:MAG: phosphonate C-P lyase system protein PhnG [Hyphomonadaceae bacterium]|nr:phosphonate C-P lyase system protein PhnG [Hyphomonadaceae bacterium]